MHRFRQLDPSWLCSGQTTSLLESVIEKEDVNEDRGGILTNARTPNKHAKVVGDDGEADDEERRP